MQTLADIKRAMTVGRKVQVVNHVYPHLSGTREVLVAQSKRWCLSFPDGHPKAAEHNGSWLDIPKAAQCTIHGDTFVIARDVGWGDPGPFCTITIIEEAS